MIGPLEVNQSTRQELLSQAQEDGDLKWETAEDAVAAERRIGIMLALVAASREYQFA